MNRFIKIKCIEVNKKLYPFWEFNAEPYDEYLPKEMSTVQYVDNRGRDIDPIERDGWYDLVEKKVVMAGIIKARRISNSKVGDKILIHPFKDKQYLLKEEIIVKEEVDSIDTYLVDKESLNSYMKDVEIIEDNVDNSIGYVELQVINMVYITESGKRVRSEFCNKLYKD